MKKKSLAVAALATVLALSSLAAAPGRLRPVTVEDEMKLRAIVDVRISPDGERVAYGGHVLYEPMLQREQMRRNLEWFSRWINPSLRTCAGSAADGAPSSGSAGCGLDRSTDPAQTPERR